MRANQGLIDLLKKQEYLVLQSINGLNNEAQKKRALEIFELSKSNKISADEIKKMFSDIEK